MKKAIILFLSFLSLTAVAQNEVKRIAILETVDRAGDVNLGVKNLLRQSITFGINRLQGYEGYNRVDMAQITGEHNFQRTGYVSDSDIKKLRSTRTAQPVRRRGLAAWSGVAVGSATRSAAVWCSSRKFIEMTGIICRRNGHC